MDKFVNELNRFFHVSVELPRHSIIFFGSIMSIIVGVFLVLLGVFRKIEIPIYFGVAVILSNLWGVNRQK
ncbi:hypothetical protein [Clostridium frigidicarnis]|uniref:Uncharacterized protein n=1 Tax=Clostridium frigidicarnis TaxID=84698 RepID=A0A1I1A891_9CLOT|nr:hypothetical protein [Clostridium frigidicarnis]SFB33626.1 hypothetical protein SAMN04488528_103050 [Clostridium frigidicarnis]